MINKLIWALFAALISAIGIFFYITPPNTSGGDIVEYFGMTESLIKSGSFALTDVAYSNLKQSLNPGYFVDLSQTLNNGGFLYYMTAKDGNRYPVHFFFYSLLALPVRLLLHVLHINELDALRYTNLILLALGLFYILKEYAQTSWKRFLLLLTVFTSPVVSFIMWPGPDIYYLILLLIAAFLFGRRQYVASSAAVALASWHSQPLLVLSLLILIYYSISHIQVHIGRGEARIKIALPIIGALALIGTLLVIPYVYNYMLFGVLTPWTVLRDGWTQINGFGLHNVSFQKLFEQFFDLNMGLFWYAPVLLIAGIYCMVQKARGNAAMLFLLASLLITAVFYETNPAWHYGTSGFGPTRHIIFLVPFLIFALAEYTKPVKEHGILLLLLLLSQSYILSFNGFLRPDFTNSLKHSPYATYVLDYYPALYNPTPEIFVDRTNHTDLKVPSSAIYTKNGLCKKAYILYHDIPSLKKICGAIPEQYLAQLDDPFSHKSNYPRRVKTIEATFWPDPASCAKEYMPLGERTFVCIRSYGEALKATGITDVSRFHQVEAFDGVWRLDRGDPIEIIVPPGYIIQYYSLKGAYVNF